MNGANWERRCCIGASASIAHGVRADDALEYAVHVRVHAAARFAGVDLAEALRFEDVDEAVAHARVLEVPALARAMRQASDLLIAIPAEACAARPRDCRVASATLLTGRPRCSPNASTANGSLKMKSSSIAASRGCARRRVDGDHHAGAVEQARRRARRAA